MDKANSFGLPFFYRVVLPGFVFVVVLLPVLVRILTTLGVRNESAAAALAFIGLAAGLAVAAMDDPIYQFFEGRALWPSWLYALRVGRWRGYVSQLFKKYCEMEDKKQTSDWRYLELANKLRRFPATAAGVPYAARPTLLGNILAAYESYPENVYGLHPVAFWQRVWLLLDKDTRDEIDRGWAPTDALTYVAAVLWICAAGYLSFAAIAALAKLVNLDLFFTSEEVPVALYVAYWLVLLAFIPYRLSISGHVTNGETLKAVFDLKRSQLEAIQAPASEAQKLANTRLSQLLVYGRSTANEVGDTGRSQDAVRPGEVH